MLKSWGETVPGNRKFMWAQVIIAHIAYKLEKKKNVSTMERDLAHVQ